MSRVVVGLCKGNALDFVIRKSTEVQAIFTEFS
jgi:hypothetical protein